MNAMHTQYLLAQSRGKKLLERDSRNRLWTGQTHLHGQITLIMLLFV